MDKSTRKSNFELLRIISMIMIVMLHTLGKGSAFTSFKLTSINFFIVNILESLSIVSVNCYILISGYFGGESKFRFRKLVDLYMQILFYSISISVVFWLLGIYKINKADIYRTLFPISFQNWWFMSMFFILYLLTPYINKLLKSLSFKEFNFLLVILITVFVIWPSIFVLKPVDITGGYSLYNFIFLYIVGFYINKYFKDKSFNKYILISIYLLFSLLLALFNIKESIILNKNYGMYNYNFILVFIESIALFLFFKELKINNNKIINSLAGLTLGVYLIHEHIYVRSFIYKFLGYRNYFYGAYFITATILIVLLIYSVSSLIEYLRQFLFSFRLR